MTEKYDGERVNMAVYFWIVVGFCVIYPLIPRKDIKWIFALLTVVLSVLAYFCEPLKTDDLSRYYNTLETLRNVSLSGYFDLQRDGYANFDAVPVCGLYFFFISKLGNNNLLPAITIFITYGSMFLVIWRFAQRYKVSKLYMFVAVLFLLSTYWYYDTCSGIRNGLAFNVCMFCLYFDLIEEKNKLLCWIGYFVALGIHSAAIIMLALRAFAELTFRIKRKFVNIFALVAITCGASIIELAGKFFNNSFMNVLLEKTEKNASRIVSFGPTTILNLAVIVWITVVFIYTVQLVKKAEIEGLDKFFNFMVVLLTFTFGSLSSWLIFVRLMHWVIPLFGSLVIMLCFDLNRRERMKTKAEHRSIIKRDVSVYRSNERIFTLGTTALSTVVLVFVCFISVVSAAVFSA